MAKRNRYREMESLMTKIIVADALIFVLYLVCAAMAWTVLKVITAIIAIFGSLLCLFWLYLTGEFPPAQKFVDGNRLRLHRPVRAVQPAAELPLPQFLITP